MRRICESLLAVCLMAVPLMAHAGGPLGIDHRVAYDNSGIWARSNQTALIGATVVTVLGGSLLLGDQDKLGDTFWRSLDSTAAASVVALGGKLIFQRERPRQDASPDDFFKGTQYHSFPSGEVSAIAGAVTPFIVAYGSDHPAVYALEIRSGLLHRAGRWSRYSRINGRPDHAGPIASREVDHRTD